MQRASPNACLGRDRHRAAGDDERPSSRPMERRLSAERRLVIRPMAGSPRWLTLLACTRPTSRLIGAAQLGSSAEAVSTRSSCTEITTIGGVSIPIAAAAGSRFVPHRPYSARFDPPIGIRARQAGGLQEQKLGAWWLPQPPGSPFPSREPVPATRCGPIAVIVGTIPSVQDRTWSPSGPGLSQRERCPNGTL